MMGLQVMPGCDPAEVARLADDARRAVEALFRAVEAGARGEAREDLRAKHMKIREHLAEAMHTGGLR
jgi:hypothetical protein